MREESGLEHFSVQQLRSELIHRGVDLGLMVAPQASLETVDALKYFRSEQIYEVLRAKQLSIYGVDNRKDLYEIADPLIQRHSDGVVAIFNLNMLTPNGNGTSRIATRPFGSLRPLCPDEPFIDQPASVCDTGFLVARKIVLTAGHIVNLPHKYFVFGFRMTSATFPQVFDISDSQIYRGKRIIAANPGQPGSDDDFALIELDQVVTDYEDRVLTIRRTGRIKDGERVQVLGHPRGLPLKFADGARVTNNTNDSFFVANLDTYVGNSGSPVFNSSTHIVEGILVRGGERDFVHVGHCEKSLVCPVISDQPECSGEECMRVARIASLIP
jgi:hypothetical protein